MKITSILFLAFVFTQVLGLYILYDYVRGELKPSFKQSAEETLVDFAHSLASIVEVGSSTGQMNTEILVEAFRDLPSRNPKARIFDLLKNSIDVRVYVVDRDGMVRFDSEVPGAVGEDYSQWRDVMLTLQGKYGARASDRNGKGALYVAAPIHSSSGEILGVLSIEKPTANILYFVAKAEHALWWMVIYSVLAVGGVAAVLSVFIARPLVRLTNHARNIRDGRRSVFRNARSKEVQVLASSLEEMRESLEGKKYIENYVQSLTHELKSPLTAIRGAAELLEGNLPEADRQRFLSNILSEVHRCQKVIDELLALAIVENQKEVLQKEWCSLENIVEEILVSFHTELSQREVAVEIDSKEVLRLELNRSLISQALRNVIHNAIEFSPSGGRIFVKMESDEKSVLVTVQDEGPGIPEYARDRIFERFYSLPRPESRRKSSGLGLPLTREIVTLHGGVVTVKNSRDKSGCIVQIRLPLSSANS